MLTFVYTYIFFIETTTKISADHRNFGSGLGIEPETSNTAAVTYGTRQSNLLVLLILHLILLY